MSGGKFDYIQYRFNEITDRIIEAIVNNGEEDYEEYKPETLERLKEAVYIIKKAYIYVNRVDYLMMGDDSEETFEKRLSTELKKLDSNSENGKYKNIEELYERG